MHSASLLHPTWLSTYELGQDAAWEARCSLYIIRLPVAHLFVCHLPNLCILYGMNVIKVLCFLDKGSFRQNDSHLLLGETDLKPETTMLQAEPYNILDSPETPEQFTRVAAEGTYAHDKSVYIGPRPRSSMGTATPG